MFQSSSGPYWCTKRVVNTYNVSLQDNVFWTIVMIEFRLEANIIDLLIRYILTQIHIQ
jgi:hypothetical protein